MDEKKITKKYSNADITIVWQPHLCIHSANCVRGLPAVFNSRKRPWITMEEASTQEIIEQVNKCPSGALSYTMNKAEEQTEAAASQVQIEVAENGPLLVQGNILLRDQNGEQMITKKVTALCRCGHSANKPYCDGSHRRENFKG